MKKIFLISVFLTFFNLLFLANNSVFAACVTGDQCLVSGDKCCSGGQLYECEGMTSQTFLSTAASSQLSNWQALPYADVHDSPTAINVASAGYLGQEYNPAIGSYSIWREVYFFDTSVIPSGAVISGATFNVWGGLMNTITPFDITIQNGQPTYPHSPVVAEDYYYDNYSGNGGSLSTSSFVTGAYNNITITNLTWIQKGAITKLALKSSRDISAIAPTGSEYVFFGGSAQLQVSFSSGVWTPTQNCSTTSQVCCSGTTPTDPCSGATCQCCVAALTYTLTVSKSGTGSGTINGTGINCGFDCSESYTSGTSVALIASAAAGSTFASWSGGGCSGTGTCTVIMNANRSVTATFNTAVCQCSDGTLCNQCRTGSPPNYCDSSGNFVNRCGAPENCGCPSGQSCQADGSCTAPPPAPLPGGNWHTYLSDTTIIAYQGLVPCGKEVCIAPEMNGDEVELVGGIPNCTGGYKEITCTFCHFFVMIDGIVDFALAYVIFPLAALLFVIGGVLFIFSAGDPGRINQGKTIMKSVVIGILIIFLAWVVVNTILTLTGLINPALGWDPTKWFEITCQ